MAQKEMTLFTDSCPQGFGCVLFRDSTIQILAGPWKYEEHINVLECRALREGIRMLPMMSTLTHVTILVDNTSTLGAFKKTRSSNFCMNWITADIHDLIRAKNFVASIAYVHTSQNLADAPSRMYCEGASSLPQRMRITVHPDEVKISPTHLELP